MSDKTASQVFMESEMGTILRLMGLGQTMQRMETDRIEERLVGTAYQGLPEWAKAAVGELIALFPGRDIQQIMSHEPEGCDHCKAEDGKWRADHLAAGAVLREQRFGVWSAACVALRDPWTVVDRTRATVAFLPTLLPEHLGMVVIYMPHEIIRL